MRITANQVTFSRLILMPGLCWLLYGGETQLRLALILGTLIGCTDFVDGYLARKYGPTVLGGLMDPIADKVFIAVAFLPYADRDWTPWWLVAALFLREFLVTALRSCFERRALTLKSSYLAKVKTWVQMCGLGLLMAVLVIHTPAWIYGILGVFTVGPLLGWVIARIRTGRSSRGALVGAFSFGLATLVYAVGSSYWLTIALFVGMVGITWITGLDYIVTGVREWVRTRELTAFDGVRIIGSIALPLLAILVLVHVHAAPWAVITLVAIEMAHGGLDNLLAHHGAAASATVWGARMFIASACLGAGLIVPALATPLAAAALAVSLIGTIVAFVRNRRFYLEAELREQKMDVAPAAPGAVS